MLVAGTPKMLFNLRQQFAVCVRLSVEDELLQRQVWNAEGWQSISEAEIPSANMFSQVIFIVPADICVFKTCYFPQHLVNEKELAEALELDIQHWNPWITAHDYVYSYHLQAETWQVQVWLWQREPVLAWQQHTALDVTHVIPEVAWYAACIPTNATNLLIHAQTNNTAYALVNAHGQVEKLSIAHQMQAAARLWHGWGAIELETAWLTAEIKDVWLPENITVKTLAATVKPNSRKLKFARVAGLRDWSDPLSYKNLFVTIVLAWLLWMGADAALLHSQQEAVQTQLTAVQQTANTVLNLRKQVLRRQKLFTEVQTLRYQQQLPEHLLARLTEVIPLDTWLQQLHLEADQLDIHGTGLEVMRLLPLLEQLPEVEQVLLLNALNPNAKTGTERFQMRLVLTTP